jgi:hypothetical protein
MKKLLSILCLLAALTACSSDDSTGNDRPATMTEGRTVLIYMAAENSLSPHVANSLEQIKAGSRLIGSGNTLLVYVDRSEPKELPWLARIRDGVVTDSVSLSDMGISQQNEYASDPQLMESVLKYAFSHHPAKHDYGLVLWGHSTGWLVDPDTIAYKRAYGVDNGHNDRSDVGKWVNLPTLARVLGKQPHLKFIFADCCNFMCLESLYELRTVTDYIIGSPAEIPGVGAPYQQVVPAMFGASDDFCRDVAANYYARPVNGRTLPMTVVQTSALPELAQATRRVLTTIGNRLAGSYADLTGLIHYYNSGAVFSPDYNIFYDAGDFIAKHAPASDYQSWQQALSRAVVCKFYAPMWNTDKPWSSFYADFTATESRCHGLSMFVPQDPARGSYARYNRDIKQLQWYYAAGLDAIAH